MVKDQSCFGNRKRDAFAINHQCETQLFATKRAKGLVATQAAAGAGAATDGQLTPAGEHKALKTAACGSHDVSTTQRRVQPSRSAKQQAGKAQVLRAPQKASSKPIKAHAASKPVLKQPSAADAGAPAASPAAPAPCHRASLKEVGNSGHEQPEAPGGAALPGCHSCKDAIGTGTCNTGTCLGSDCSSPCTCDTDKQEAAAPVGLPPLPRFGLPTLDLSEVQVKQPGWFFPVMLGEGGSAKVYKGRWEGADVALKVVHKQQDFQGLQMEGLLLAGMRHPNLLQPYAFIEDPGQLTWGILLPMYKDGSVRDALFVCAQQPETMLTQAERVHIALKAAGGIRYMQNLTHNGIKSMNLLCDLSNRSDMQVVVADLGCSIQGCGSTGSFDNDICNGTRQWRSPEHYKQGTKLTQKVDTFVFGVVLWELANHCTAYPNADYTYGSLLHGAHVRDGVRLLLPEGWPAAYTALMTDCWAELPQDGPCFGQVVQRLEALLADMCGAAVTGPRFN